MRGRRAGAVLGLAALLSGCGGGGGSGAPVTGSTGTTPPVVTTPTGTCSLRARQDWVLAQMREWYLFPETLPVTLDPAAYATVDDYLDALTATARAQGKDRFFTFLTSIREEDAFYDTGTSAGFGIRLALDSGSNRLFVSEAFEGAPALQAGIDRGAEIVGIGTSSAMLRSVSSIFAAGGVDALSDALGPGTTGTSRVLRVSDVAGTRDVTIVKADFALAPVSTRFGSKIIADGGRQVAYLNLRTFIETADDPLRAAFQRFRDAGITDFVVDLRYNGGGLVSTAELLADLLGGNRAAADVVDYTTYRPDKASENETRRFEPQSQSASPLKIAFIGTGETASASELVINAFVPYLHANAALIGTNTFGKPVGQIALDRSACDDRLRVVAFALQNAARVGDYYDGLASKMEASCTADDDIFHPLGDPAESSLRAALDYLAGRSCTRIAATTMAKTASSGATVEGGIGRRRLETVTPERPTTPQREVPGSF